MGTNCSPLALEESQRHELWRRVAGVVEDYWSNVRTTSVAPAVEVEKLPGLIEPFTFDLVLDPLQAVDFVTQSLWRHQVHTPHPRYFGLFNPAPAIMGIAADTLVAAFNSQLAAWSHAPFAVEIERHLVRASGKRLATIRREQMARLLPVEKRHEGILNRTCRMTTNYMPPDVAGFNIIDPYVHSLQWSRRFIGLKVFLSLAVAGWGGYARILRHQTEMGELLREKLIASAWQVVNTTKLPVVCFIDTQSPNGRSPAYLDAIAAEVEPIPKLVILIPQSREKNL